MRFTIPATVPADAILGDGYALQWLGTFPDQDAVEVQFSTPIDGVLASGYGATPADAMCGLLSAFPDSDEVRLPACVAAAMNELGHQSIDIVCNRLCGGTMDSATFADPIVFDTGLVEHPEGFDISRDPETGDVVLRGPMFDGEVLIFYTPENARAVAASLLECANGPWSPAAPEVLLIDCPNCLGFGLVDDPIDGNEFPCPDCKGRGKTEVTPQ